MRRGLLAVTLAIVWVLALVATAFASGPCSGSELCSPGGAGPGVQPDCNRFEAVQSVILSEGTRQPLAAQIEIARVAVTKGACFRDENFYSGWGIARFVMEYEPSHCILMIHCRAYFMLMTIDPAIRESAAVAAYVALTEEPRVPRHHFDNWQSSAYWWDSKAACPDGWMIVAEVKVC